MACKTRKTTYLQIRHTWAHQSHEQTLLLQMRKVLGFDCSKEIAVDKFHRIFKSRIASKQKRYHNSVRRGGESKPAEECGEDGALGNALHLDEMATV